MMTPKGLLPTYLTSQENLMSLLISKDLVVSIHYTLTNTNGDVLDSSEGQQPLTYLHGANNIIPGLEKELTGKTEGSSLKVIVPPEEGYGPSLPEMVTQVPRDLFQGVEELAVGMSFQAQGPDGQAHMVTIAAIDGDNITVDGNHPLAGETLHFDVSVISVREASDEEKQHGHPH
jgi:FKBP-type peptidyl-prolyl cis-trans isomerase SlyD